MFGFYHKFQQDLDRRFPSMPCRVNHGMAAMLAGTIEMSLAPFERIQTLLQNKTFHSRFRNTFDAAAQLRTYGLKEYYRGGTTIFLRNGPSNVMFFLGREYLNEVLPDAGDSSSGGQVLKDFVCGACLGAMISTVFFPLNVVKTRMQSSVGGDFTSAYRTFREIWSERNQSVSRLFRGCHLNYTRSFISWGIINASYEILMDVFKSWKCRDL